MKQKQPPKVVFVVVSDTGPQYVSRTRKRAVEAARSIWSRTEVLRYEHAPIRSRK